MAKKAMSTPLATSLNVAGLPRSEPPAGPEPAARGLLVKAFIAEIIEELENEPLVEALETRLTNWLEAHA